MIIATTEGAADVSLREMMERGDDTASAACTPILYRVCYDPPPMNTPVREGETIEGSRTMRNRPYPELKCSKWSLLMYIITPPPYIAVFATSQYVR